MGKDKYPDYVREAMARVKEESGGFCERCHSPNNPIIGRTLTVYHLEPVIKNIERYNLAALCQRCHLTFQHINPFFTWLVDWPDYYLRHCEEWFRPHLELYLRARTASQSLPALDGDTSR